MAHVSHTRRRIVALAVLVAVATAIAATDTTHEWIEQILDSVSHFIRSHPRTGVAVFMLFSALSAMLAFFSSAVVVPIAVYVWGERATALLLWLSWLMGGCCSYVIGRRFGRRVASWFVRPKRFDYYSSKISKDAGFPTILLFQIALPSEIPGYVLGATRYRFLMYLAALAIAELPYALGAVYLGESFVRRNYLLLILIGLAGILLSTVAFRQLHRRFEKVKR